MKSHDEESILPKCLCIDKHEIYMMIEYLGNSGRVTYYTAIALKEKHSNLFTFAILDEPGSSRKSHMLCLNLLRLDGLPVSHAVGSTSICDVKLSSRAARVSLWSLNLLYCPQQQGSISSSVRPQYSSSYNIQNINMIIVFSSPSCICFSRDKLPASFT